MRRAAFAAKPEVRLAAFYALVFGAFGVSLPYWPLWLAARGLDPEKIGLVFALTSLAKILAIPVAAALADRLDRRRRVIVCLLAASLVTNFCFLPAEGWPAILAISFCAVLVTSPVMSLTDTLALMLARDGRLDYGRVRLFGSLGFMLVALGAGVGIAGRPADLILWLLLGLMAAAFLASFLLPEARASDSPAHHRSLAGPLAAMATLLARPAVAWFLLAAGLIQNSHLAYYGFGTIYWRAAGIGSATIGWLWAEGVIAEIILFAAAPALLRRIGPERLIMLGGAGGVLRWTALGLSTDLAVLVPAQLLHALSFAAAHLGAMLYLARQAPAGLSATAQGLYAALPLGIGTGLVYAATGLLFEHWGGSAAFLAMAALAALGIAAMGRASRHAGRIRAM
jgi:PPP family 3-phenylpropionic acid transporter